MPTFARFEMRQNKQRFSGNKPDREVIGLTKYEIIATATFGLEAVVASELKSLGYSDLQVQNGRVVFSAPLNAVCRANLWLRSADRVRLKIGEFTALSFDQLFEETKALPWADLLPENASFPVDGKSVQSKLFSVSDCQALVKKAIVESMKKRYRSSWFAEDGPLYRIEVSLLKDTATLTIDTSGAGLHKRGYRVAPAGTPLRETLAAALILLSRWEFQTCLIDPFCGSGTIPIEAALIALNIAPGLKREFASENWPNLPHRLWQEARQEAEELSLPNRVLEIAGTDINNSAIMKARKNAEAAGVSDKIHFQCRPVEELSSKKKYGKVICNPPFGERLGDIKTAEQLYRSLGPVFKNLEGWSYYILTSSENFEELFGQKASRRRKLYHGNIKTQYYQYFGPRPPRRENRGLNESEKT